jgi:hypothetical protein
MTLPRNPVTWLGVLGLIACALLRLTKDPSMVSAANDLLPLALASLGLGVGGTSHSILMASQESSKVAQSVKEDTLDIRNNPSLPGSPGNVSPDPP